MSKEKDTDELEAQRRSRLLFLVERLYAQQNKLFLRHHLLVPELERILRWVSVQLALLDPEFAIEGRDAEHRQTHSHAAVTTGLARQEVAEQMSMARPPVDPLGGNLHRLIRVLTAWRLDDGYQDDAGRPIDLPLRGGAPSLHQLCLKYGRHTPARPLADILVKNGNAEWVESGGNGRAGKKLRFPTSVVTAALNPGEDVMLFTQIGSDFMHSFQRMFDPHLQPRPRFREGYFNDINTAKADEALAVIHDEIQSFNIRCTDILNKYRAEPGEPTMRIGVGSYSFRNAPNLLDDWQLSQERNNENRRP